MIAKGQFNGMFTHSREFKEENQACGKAEMHKLELECKEEVHSIFSKFIY